MIVLSHRGYWKNPTEKNTEAAFRRSFTLGFGTETDLRDRSGELVVSHDPPTGAEMTAEALLTLHAEFGPHLPLALNVKADGLQARIDTLLKRFAVRDAFVFDMAVPDALGYLRLGVPAFTRHSEEETAPSFYGSAAGVWLDAFYGEWYGPDVIARHLHAGKRVCLVSPDLHRRPHRPFWDALAGWVAGWPVGRQSGVMLCTDFPEDARAVFGPGA
jgi:hypothetical protein